MAREIRYTAAWKLTLGFFIWAAITGTFLYLSGKELHEDYLFTHHAIPVTGKVVQKHYTVSHGRHGASYTYHVSYNYEAGNVQGFCQQTVQYGTYQYLSEGGPIPVMYLPDNPAKVRVNLVAEERAKHFDTGILCTVAGIFLFGGGFIITRIWLTNEAWQRLRREGIPTRGVVNTIGTDYVGKARTPKSFLQFEYRDSLGSTLAGKSLYLNGEQLQRWRPGDSIEVTYDRNKPRTFTIDLNSGRRDTPGAGDNPSSRA
jgi:hypothetical protein